MAGIIWSDENRDRLDNAIKEFGEDKELPSDQMAKIVGVMHQTLLRWSRMVKHREALSSNGEVSVFITLGNLMDFVLKKNSVMDWFTPEYISLVVAASPGEAALYLRNRLSKKQIDQIVTAHPNAAAEYLFYMLTDDQVAHIVTAAPWSAAKYLFYRLTDDQVSQIIAAEPWAAAVYLPHLLSEEQVAHIAAVEPWAAAKHLPHLLSEEQVAYIEKVGAELSWASAELMRWTIN